MEHSMVVVLIFQASTLVQTLVQQKGQQMGEHLAQE